MKPSEMGGALYGIFMAWIHYYKIKKWPKINVFNINELHL